ncbi:hypothetical protein H8959_003248 [Pygathrix nigripes]
MGLHSRAMQKSLEALELDTSWILASQSTCSPALCGGDRKRKDKGGDIWVLLEAEALSERKTFFLFCFNPWVKKYSESILTVLPGPAQWQSRGSGTESELHGCIWRDLDWREPEPKPGDLIEIFRPFYRHWAIYVGDGYVVHLAPPSEVAGAGAASVMSALTDKAIVKKELLYDVAGSDKYQVNNKHDDKYSPLPYSKIIQRAEELVGQEVLYKLTSENCEHFVNELRYGVATPGQTHCLFY